MGLKHHDTDGEGRPLREILADELGESVEEIRRGVAEMELGPPWEAEMEEEVEQHNQ